MTNLDPLFENILATYRSSHNLDPLESIMKSLDKQWQNIDVEDGYCKDCHYLSVLPDANGTGDSPTEITCEANSYKDCHRLAYEVKK